LRSIAKRLCGESECRRGRFIIGARDRGGFLESELKGPALN
jgi:hypothetical protein